METLESMKNDDEAIRKYGVKLATDMCRELLQSDEVCFRKCCSVFYLTGYLILINFKFWVLGWFVSQSEQTLGLGFKNFNFKNFEIVN